MGRLELKPKSSVPHQGHSAPGSVGDLSLMSAILPSLPANNSVTEHRAGPLGLQSPLNKMESGRNKVTFINQNQLSGWIPIQSHPFKFLGKKARVCKGKHDMGGMKGLSWVQGLCILFWWLSWVSVCLGHGLASSQRWLVVD